MRHVRLLFPLLQSRVKTFWGKRIWGEMFVITGARFNNGVRCATPGPLPSTYGCHCRICRSRHGKRRTNTMHADIQSYLWLGGCNCVQPGVAYSRIPHKFCGKVHLSLSFLSLVTSILHPARCGRLIRQVLKVHHCCTKNILFQANRCPHGRLLLQCCYEVDLFSVEAQ